MSHDEQTDRGTDGPGPDRLARWLDQPPDVTPPVDLDEDVVEAVIALRPERAPTLRLNADDILASITRGPLAADPAAAAAGGPEPSAPGEVLPFPSRPRPEAAAAPVAAGGPRRWVAWAGGTSSIGLALVAAAVLLFVVLPEGNAPTFDAARQEAAPMSSASAPAAEEQARKELAADDAPSPEAAAPAAEPPPPAQSLAEAPARARVAATAPATPGPAPIEMSDGALYKSTTTIPELQDAVAAADEEAPPAEEVAGLSLAEGGEQRKAEASAPEDPGAVRARAVPRDLQANGWRKELDRPTLDAIDQALAEAKALRSAGDRRGAGDRLAPMVGGPARAGQHVAALAAGDYLAAGAPSSAVSVAATGLGLSSANTPERSQLLVVYGDALMATGNVAGALDAWRQAETANAGR